MRDLTSSSQESLIAATSSRQARARLQDMEDHLAQCIPQLVHSEDGGIYVVWHALKTEQVDVEPFPALSPQMRLLPPGESASTVDFGTAAAVHRIEQSLAEYGIQDLSDAEGRQMLARANFAAIKQVHDFQVVWLGSRKEWLVTEGNITWFEGTQATNLINAVERTAEIPRTFLDGREGWITLPCAIQPEDYDGSLLTSTAFGGYRLKPHPAPVISAGVPQQRPSIRSFRFSGVLGDSGNNLVERRTHSSGTIHIPIAWVSPPNVTRRAPIIRPFTKGHIRLQEVAWLGSLPGLTFL